MIIRAGLNTGLRFSALLALVLISTADSRRMAEQAREGDPSPAITPA